MRAAARLTWKDQRGDPLRHGGHAQRQRFRVYVECQSPVSIPLFRLVQFSSNATPAISMPCPTRSSRQGPERRYRVTPPSHLAPRIGPALMLTPTCERGAGRGERATA